MANKNPSPETRFGGKRANPRHNGAWKKADTPRYKLEQMMKLSFKELQDVATDEEAPLFERKIAKCLADGDWKTIKEMISEVYGTPKQSVDVTSGGEKIKTIVEIVDARSQSTDT